MELQQQEQVVVEVVVIIKVAAVGQVGQVVVVQDKELVQEQLEQQILVVEAVEQDVLEAAQAVQV
tara:strand:+ start:537 stop:731 length:195 start_codon:yes stop_codon:yes gene_type:complete